MAKTYVNAVKYMVNIEFEIKGVVDKPDIVGAIFGQSEGLLGEEMDLRELQKNGRVGRIEIEHKTSLGATKGSVVIPSSMDMVETSLLAAAIETVDKVGPCEARFRCRGIEDTRNLKRKEVMQRAQTLLRNMLSTQIPETTELAEQVRNLARTAVIQSYGKEKLPCGPSIKEDDSIIVVEGRADVLNLLKNGIKNVIAMGGSKMPQSVIDLCNKKTVTLFVDGDRGGELNIRKLQQLADIDFIARAPDGKEVEELARKEIIMSLRRKVPAAQALKPEAAEKPAFKGKALTAKPAFAAKPAFKSSGFRKSFSKPFQSFSKVIGAEPSPKNVPAPVSPEDKKKFDPLMAELRGSLKAKLLDAKLKEIETVPVRELLNSLSDKKKIHTIVFDGIITKRVIEEAKKNKVSVVVGVKKGRIAEDKDVKAIALG